MSKLIKDITRNVAFHSSVRHMAVYFVNSSRKLMQGPHSVLGELKRLVPAQS